MEWIEKRVRDGSILRLIGNAPVGRSIRGDGMSRTMLPTRYHGLNRRRRKQLKMAERERAVPPEYWQGDSPETSPKRAAESRRTAGTGRGT